jgi:hypothetical protein
MHWVLIYFLMQPVGNGQGHGLAGGVGQIRFKTKQACERFYRRLQDETSKTEVKHSRLSRFPLKEKAHSFTVDGLCMVWTAS